MTDRYITTNTTSVSSGNGESTFVAPNVVVNYGIDMRGTADSPGGGSQVVVVHGTLFGSIDDYFTDTSGHDQIFIGATGNVTIDWSDAIMLGGGGHYISNQGSLTASNYGTTIYILSTAASFQNERDVILNTGTIAGTSLDPTRTSTDATIYVSSNVGATVFNSGSILAANGYAMTFNGTGAEVITNIGTIQGNVSLGEGNNSFDSRGGIFKGDLLAGSGNDTIHGSADDNKITASAGNDFIDGYGGADTMIGGVGDDTYVVDDTGDVVDESGGGLDTIMSSISFDLSDGSAVIGTVETLKLLGTGNLRAFGSVHDDAIYGNIGDNAVSGDSGGDTLVARAGDDTLHGDDGDDSLNAGAGNDTLFGDQGNDALNGAAGADTMYGGQGNDVYLVDDLGDVVSEQGAGSDGIDKINSSISISLANTAQVKGPVENLTLLGGTAIDGTGNNLANKIVGNTAVNYIDGGLGNDTLTGGAGADRFYFTTVLNSTTNKDTITDFVHNSDKLVLDHAIFTSLSAGNLPANELAINAPADANDFIIYNTTTGVLSYDADGNGAGGARAFAVLTGVPGLTQVDFLVI